MGIKSRPFRPDYFFCLSTQPSALTRKLARTRTGLYIDKALRAFVIQKPKVESVALWSFILKDFEHVVRKNQLRLLTLKLFIILNWDSLYGSFFSKNAFYFQEGSSFRR